MKNWKDVTKLDKIDKGRIAICIVMIIYTITSAIILKNIAWFVCVLLWGNIAIITYFDAKLLKGKNYIIKRQDNIITTNHEIIYRIIEENKREFIKLSDIKISKKFTKPRKEKLDHRMEYYRVYKNFEVPIILDKNNVLVDGYTTYLIARKEGFSHISFKRKESK